MPLYEEPRRVDRSHHRFLSQPLRELLNTIEHRLLFQFWQMLDLFVNAISRVRVHPPISRALL